MAISSAADISMLQQVATYASDVMQVSDFRELEGMVDTVVASSCVSSQPQPPNANQQVRSGRIRQRQRQGAGKLNILFSVSFFDFLQSYVHWWMDPKRSARDTHPISVQF